eukprot:scaffold1033_cov408-Prasinococcus_capsulatus_cf.AAC.36
MNAHVLNRSVTRAAGGTDSEPGRRDSELDRVGSAACHTRRAARRSRVRCYADRRPSTRGRRPH